MNRKQRRSAKHKPTASYQASPYLAALTNLGLSLQPGTIQRVDIHHDDWCDLLSGRGYCNCNPVVGAPELVDMNTEGNA